MAKLVKNNQSGEFEIVDVWSEEDIINVISISEDIETPPTNEELQLLMETLVKNYDCNTGIDKEIIYATWCNLKSKKSLEKLIDSRREHKVKIRKELHL